MCDELFGREIARFGQEKAINDASQLQNRRLTDRSREQVPGFNSEQRVVLSSHFVRCTSKP